MDDGPRAVVVRWIWAEAAMKSPPAPILDAYVKAKAALDALWQRWERIRGRRRKDGS